MKLKPNYLYRLLGDAEKDGLVTKTGRTYKITAKGSKEIEAAKAAQSSSGNGGSGEKAPSAAKKDKGTETGFWVLDERGT